MPSLRDIKKRITSVQSTKQITRTMEMVATAKIRRATERITAATPYSDSMMEMLRGVAERATTLEHPLLKVHEEEKSVLVIAIVSDRGLAGGFNSNVLRAVDHIVSVNRAAGKEVKLIACGKKAIAYFNYRKLNPVMIFRDLSADPTVEEARQIADYAIDAYSKSEIDEVVVVYNHARNAADQDVMQEQILPIETQNLANASEESSPSANFEFEPSAEAVLTQ
ncbi:MAG: ATP synthase F1 subunit gamma, partial [Actinobacteria bacterium]|nr:ATP synthase F1 subunit gamma [Actinomycetota bacterium]